MVSKHHSGDDEDALNTLLADHLVFQRYGQAILLVFESCLRFGKVGGDPFVEHAVAVLGELLLVVGGALVVLL